MAMGETDSGTWTLFGSRYHTGKGYKGVYSNVLQAALHAGLDQETYLCLEVREAVEDEEPDLHGWLDADNERGLTMVHDSFLKLDICFPGGVKGAVEKGRGRPVKLVVLECMDVDKKGRPVTNDTPTPGGCA